jgi:hypothetical protein
MIKGIQSALVTVMLLIIGSVHHMQVSDLAWLITGIIVVMGILPVMLLPAITKWLFNKVSG